MRAGRLLLILSLMAAWLPACGGKTNWYKDGYNQADFNRDQQDCGFVAEAAARRRTLTGRRADPFAIEPALAQCLMGKGWSPVPPDARQADGAPAPERELAILREGPVVEGFGKAVRLPEGSILVRRSKQRIGPTFLESFLFQDPNDAFINLIFQENLATPFDKVDYPLNEPFYSYDLGRIGDGGELRWRSYFGRFQGSWIGGLGAYYLPEERQRIVFVVTTTLPEPEAPPPPGLHLSKGQNEAMSKFDAKWKQWAEQEFPIEFSSWHAFKGLFLGGRLAITR